MPRRRLRLSSYSDDEEQENQQQQQQHDNEANFQQCPSNPNPSIPIESVTISDDDDEVFIDVPENLSPPTETVSTHSSTQQQPPTSCPISDYLLRMGLKLKREWLDSCISGLDRGVENLDVAAKAKLCFQQFMYSDMNYSGGGLLPPNVDSMHLVDLPGPFVLQVDEIVNISCPLKGRYQDAPSGIKRCLKLSMTDGIQRVFGMEYRPIKDLQVLAPAGLKFDDASLSPLNCRLTEQKILCDVNEFDMVVICNVHIRHGLLMLVPESLDVLGGMVDELEAARQRLVEEVNKPPRGRRSRTGVVPPLTTRATLAAWPGDGVNFSGNTNNSSVGLGLANSSATFSNHSNDSVNVPGHNFNSVNGLEHASNSVNVYGHTHSNNVLEPIRSSRFQGSSPLQAEGQGNVIAPGNGTSQRTTEEFAGPMNSVDTMTNPSSSAVSNVEEMHVDSSFDRTNDISDQHYNVILDHEDIHLVDEFEHPIILSGDREIPFTYLASLSAKWAALKERASSIQGKVKCLLTGVKGFQYKQRKTYELQVYVDDGSLICEILIDHNVVQKRIGHSPQEVTAALSSSDAKRVGDMKETLKQFQKFLVNFEGIMLLEMTPTSPLPVAIEMNRGYPASDAWLLLRRLKSSAPAHQAPHRPSDPIDISP